MKDEHYKLRLHRFILKEQYKSMLSRLYSKKFQRYINKCNKYIDNYNIEYKYNCYSHDSVKNITEWYLYHKYGRAFKKIKHIIKNTFIGKDLLYNNATKCYLYKFNKYKLFLNNVFYLLIKN
jgi:hypothetical protein